MVAQRKRGSASQDAGQTPAPEGFVQGYNAQAAVDIDSHLIVAEHVSDHTNDKQELAPALRCLDERQEVVGQPRALLADAGYFSDENVKRCEAEGIEPYIASGRERHHRPLADRLARLRQLGVHSVDFHFFSATQVIELLESGARNRPQSCL